MPYTPLDHNLFEYQERAKANAMFRELYENQDAPVSGARRIQPLLPVHVSSFASSYGTVDNSATSTNYCQLIMLPVEFSAVRIGWPHLGGGGNLTGLKMLVAATDDIGDLTNTNTAAAKKFITPNKAGVEKNEISEDGWRDVTWSGAASLSITDPGAGTIDIVYSDLIPIYSQPLASDPTGRFTGWRPLLVRVYPGTAFFSRCSYIGFADPTKFLAECGPAVVLGANRSGGDFVGTVGSWTQVSTPAFSDSAVMPLIVEAYTSARQPTAMLSGDSRFFSVPAAETATTYRILANKVELAARADGVKLKIVRAGQGGLTGSVFAQRATEVLSGDIQPGVSLFLGYTINDGAPSWATLAAAKIRVLAHIKRCRELGIVPAIMSIFPIGPNGMPSQIVIVREFEAWIAALDVPWISPLQIYGNSVGNWTNSWNEDDNHMTAAGYTDLAARVWALLKPYAA